MTDTSKKHIKVTLNLIQINLKPPTIASQLPVTKKKFWKEYKGEEQ